jgi:hypothetical protein
MFNLPFATRIAHNTPFIPSFLLRTIYREGHRTGNTASSAHVEQLAHSAALTCGPSLVECQQICESGKSGSGLYGSTVLARAKKYPPGDWDQRIRLYREGLATSPWTLTSELQSQYGIPSRRCRADSSNAGSMCPMTIVFGMQELALDPRIVLDGTERYFAKADAAGNRPAGGRDGVEVQSHIVRLKNCGHWSLLEPSGERALEAILVSLLGESRTVVAGNEGKVGLEDALQPIGATDEVEVTAYTSA